MKTRRHHNNKGYRQIARGKTEQQVAAMVRRLGIPYATGDKLYERNGVIKAYWRAR